MEKLYITDKFNIMSRQCVIKIYKGKFMAIGRLCGDLLIQGLIEEMPQRVEELKNNITKINSRTEYKRYVKDAENLADFFAGLKKAKIENPDCMKDLEDFPKLKSVFHNIDELLQTCREIKEQLLKSKFAIKPNPYEYNIFGKRIADKRSDYDSDLSDGYEYGLDSGSASDGGEGSDYEPEGKVVRRAGVPGKR